MPEQIPAPLATMRAITGIVESPGAAGNPYNVPLGGMLEFTGTSAPNLSFVLPFGQAISRTAYAAYFALVGTTFGAGDGSATFNVIDKRGHVSAGKDDMGGSAANRLTSTYFGTSAAALGAAGGSESHTLTSVQMPSHTHTATVTDSGHSHTTDAQKIVAGAVFTVAAQMEPRPPLRSTPTRPASA